MFDPRVEHEGLDESAFVLNVLEHPAIEYAIPSPFIAKLCHA
jgi:hypothetical protein